ncbi:hypothetical protein [Ralstonia phage RP31]|uniref:Uncharacterized protein n=2 Tax=Ripduovirus RP12 TaxID=2560700 RepID=A0A1L7N154_9CAUD|nr:hypothetical protein FDH28_gp182 [Ralstonia phage RP12]BAW19213.1 hypothetical protein [Ralstonia phage RP12]BAW19499.1 hypothetical protein [Ralstonia phage RP31]
MKRNFFTAALESEASGAVDISEVTEVSTLQPKPGFKEDGSLAEPSTDDVKAAKEFGEDAAIADHDEIDAVAESQEHTLALEHLQSVAMRFCRMGAALEDIAEQAEASLEPVQAEAGEAGEAGEGAPAAVGEPGAGLTPETVQMLTTAIDAAGIGEPLQESVALESFGFDQRVATEGFVDVVKERAEKVWAAVAKFAKKAFELTGEKLKRFADYFRGLPKIYEKLEKEGQILNGHAGKPFQSAKWEKTVQERFYAPSSTKNPIAAVDNAGSEFDEVIRLVENKLVGEMRALSNSWATDKPETVVAAMNRCISTAKGLQDMGESRFQHSSVKVEVNLPERVTVDNTGGLEGTKVVFEEGKRDFSAGVKIASPADIKHLKETAVRAERAVMSALDALFDADFEPKYKARHSYDKDDREVARKLLSKYSNLMRVLADLSAGCVFGAAHGLYFNHFGATRWIRFSIAEAKAANRGGHKE